MKYRIKILKKAQKSLSKIPEPFQTKIINVIRSLVENPRPIKSKKLVGRNGLRIRIGNYRVIYEINKNEITILVLHIGHRKNIYKK